MSMIEQILEAVNDMPPFPQVVNKAMQVLAEPGYNVSDLVDIIKVDQAITANLLKLCNSAYFGLPRKVSSLKEAVVYLGSTQIRQLLLSGAAFKLYGKQNDGYTFFADELWRHALATAIMAQVLHRHLKLKLDVNTVFTAALLHDIGKVVLSTFVSEKFVAIERIVEAGEKSFQEAEKEILGCDHAEIGGRVAEKWEFPADIVAAIRYHHDPTGVPRPYRLLTELVALSNNLAVIVGYGTGVDGLACRAQGQLLKSLRVENKDLEKLIVLFHEDMEKTFDMIN